jgi:hypothetical protein
LDLELVGVDGLHLLLGLQVLFSVVEQLCLLVDIQLQVLGAVALGWTHIEQLDSVSCSEALEGVHAGLEEGDHCLLVVLESVSHLCFELSLEWDWVLLLELLNQLFLVSLALVLFNELPQVIIVNLSLVQLSVLHGCLVPVDSSRALALSRNELHKVNRVLLQDDAVNHADGAWLGANVLDASDHKLVLRLAQLLEGRCSAHPIEVQLQQVLVIVAQEVVLCVLNNEGTLLHFLQSLVDKVELLPNEESLLLYQVNDLVIIWIRITTTLQDWLQLIRTIWHLNLYRVLWEALDARDHSNEVACGYFILLDHPLEETLLSRNELLLDLLHEMVENILECQLVGLPHKPLQCTQLPNCMSETINGPFLWIIINKLILLYQILHLRN